MSMFSEIAIESTVYAIVMKIDQQLYVHPEAKEALMDVRRHAVRQLDGEIPPWAKEPE